MKTTDTQCIESIWNDWTSHLCKNKAKLEREGKMYCTIHDPEYIAKKDKELEKKHLENICKKCSSYMNQWNKYCSECGNKKHKKKLKKEVILCDDSDTHVITGYDSKEQARKALNRYEKKEEGLSGDELTPTDWLKEIDLRVYKKDDEEYYDWSGKKSCDDCGTKFGDMHEAFIYRF